MIRYNKRQWLNSKNSPSTGNIICFNGDITQLSNRGRHKKKKDNKIHPKITVYDSTLNCYFTFYIENNKLKTAYVKSR